MLNYIIKRISIMVLTLLLVTSSVFIIIKSAPGTYNDYNLLSEQKRGRSITFHEKEITEKIPLFYFSINRQDHNRNEFQSYIPHIDYNGLTNQYHLWLTNFLNGDWGTSLQDHMTVKSKLIKAIPISFFLGSLALLLAIGLSMAIGIYTSLYNNKLSKSIVKMLFVINSLPPYWLALLAIIFLCGGDYFAVFPPIGWATFDNETSLFENLINQLVHITLPILCISLVMLPYLVEQLAGSIKQQLTLPYVQTALAKGLSYRQTIIHHVIRNGIIPYITIIADYLTILITGSFVVEIIFSIPGMGKAMYEAIFSRNYPLIMASTTLVTVLILINNLLLDIIYSYIDPRIKLYKKVI